jgi:hypothetical protein
VAPVLSYNSGTDTMSWTFAGSPPDHWEAYQSTDGGITFTDDIGEVTSPELNWVTINGPGWYAVVGKNSSSVNITPFSNGVDMT